MQISFHGAAQTVTGSKHVISLKNGKKILLDCGLFQGKGQESDNLNRFWGFQPEEIDYMILSHAHIDHTGLIPKLVKDGYRGKVYCTPATYDVSAILLQDSANIQEQDIRQVNKRRKAKGQPPLYPLYTQEDAKTALSRFETHPYKSPFMLDENIEVTFTDAGHILGSAVVSIRIKEAGEVKKICFTGDLGRYNNRILVSPQPAEQADIVICESTYGTRIHDDTQFSTNELLQVIEKTIIQKKGKIIIPAFSVGRTQEVLFVLNQLYNERKLPGIDVFVDSPLSTHATEITRAHTELYNKKVQKILKEDHDPFGFPGVQFIEDKTESQRLNDRDDPCIIISASGMAEAGRVKHHIAHNIKNSKNTILFIGYAEPNSLGGRLQRGAENVTIFGDEYPVNAEVTALHSFSAHGDYEDICQFLACQNPALVDKFFIVHGEPDVQMEFCEKIKKKGYQESYVPFLHESFHL